MEVTRLTPHIEENLAQEVLGKRLIAHKPKKPAVDVGPMPGEQSLHRSFAANRGSLLVNDFAEPSALQWLCDVDSPEHLAAED